MKKRENMAGKIAITGAAAYFGVAALLVAQTGSGTRVEPASRPPAAAPARSGAAAPSTAGTTAANATTANSSADTVKYRAFVDKYCVSCHNSRTALPGDDPVNLQAAGFDDLTGRAGTWERVLRKLSVRAMPPQGV